MSTRILSEEAVPGPSELHSAALQLLASYVGDGLTASRCGGRRQFITMLRTQLQLSEDVASTVLTSLERQGLLFWVSAHGTSQICPGILELDGFWRFSSTALLADTDVHRMP
jgi:hypothetical protein